MSYTLTFDKKSRNAWNAAVGTITLRNGKDVVASSDVFSGGAPDPAGAGGMSPIPKGTYIIRLDIRRTATVNDIVPYKGDPSVRVLKPFYGIQRLPPPTTLGFDIGYEWGDLRAALNETKGETLQNYRGNYLHGKQRPGDYTHGCICERSEKILNILLGMNYKTISRVVVTVTS